MTEVFAIKTIPAADFLSCKDELYGLLPADSRQLIDSYKKPADLQRSLLGESLTRKIISQKTGLRPESLRISRSSKGKPRLDDHSHFHFNITHSGNWIAVVFSDREVGIDIEKCRPPQYRIAERYFSPKEVAVLNKLKNKDKESYFFDLWTMKESYLKLLGKGLTRSLGSFSVVKINGVFRLEEQDQLLDSVHFFQPHVDPDYKLAICARSDDFTGMVHQLSVNELISNHEKQ